MSEFFDQYKRPEWQKKRLEVMESAKFTCEQCGAVDKTLNVHHKLYVKGRKVWEYERDELRCLCEECHERFHEQKQELLRLIGTGACGMDRLLGFARAAAGSCYPEWDEPLTIENIEQAEGAASFLLPGEISADCDLLDLANESDDQTIRPEVLANLWDLAGLYGFGSVVYFDRWCLVDRGFSWQDIKFVLDGENFSRMKAGEVLTLPSGHRVNWNGMQSGLSPKDYDLSHAHTVGAD